jgi:cytochrome c55X
MRLTGGLGPALTREAMAERPLDSLVAVIVHGRPGTPMPPWQAMLSEPEARWIALQLQQGFPEEPHTP